MTKTHIPMKPEYLNEAIALITISNSIKVSFNVPIDNHISRTYPILIHESNASIINQLVAAGFSLSMTPKGLAVDKF